MGMIMHDDVPYGEGTSYTQGTGIAINNNIIAVDADNTPTSGSEKPVKSKGVYSALESNRDESTSLLKSTVGWTGKNLLCNKLGDTTNHGVAYKLNTDGSVTINGTADSTSVYCFNRPDNNINIYTDIFIKQGTTVIASIGVQDTNRNLLVRYTDGTWGNMGKDVPFTCPKDVGIVYMQVLSGTTVDNITIYPMLRDASITDDTYEPYHESVEEEIEQIYADNGVLGAKNLCPVTAITKTADGITFTVNSDGSITLNGTCTLSSGTYGNYIIISRADDSFYLPDGNYILNGCPSGGASNRYFLRVQCTRDGSLYTFGDDIGNGFEFKPLPTDRLQVIIRYFGGVTFDNVTFKPMIRLASDPDDTYVPYAMTNRELTEKVESIYKTATADSNGETVTFTNVDTSKSYSIEADLGTSWDGPAPSYTNVKITGTTLIYTLANANAGQSFRLIDLKR